EEPPGPLPGREGLALPQGRAPLGADERRLGLVPRLPPRGPGHEGEVPHPLGGAAAHVRLAGFFDAEIAETRRGRRDFFFYPSAISATLCVLWLKGSAVSGFSQPVRIGPEDPELAGHPLHLGKRLPGRPARIAEEVEVEGVLPGPAPERPRFDLGEVDAAQRE